jgi:type II secretory pathway component PulF
MANHQATHSKLKSVVTFVFLELIVITLIFTTLYWLYKILPGHIVLYDGMGEHLPLISRLVFKSYTLSCLPPFLAVVALGLSHLFLLKSVEALKIALFSYAILLLATIATFWYASRAPLWQLQRTMPGVHSLSR